jgi:hypothetical protein
MGVLEEILEAISAQTLEIRTLREEIATLHERVEPIKDIYTIKEFWLLMGGLQLCSFKSFQKSKDIPRADGYYRRMRAYRRETIRGYMRKFTVRAPVRRGPGSIVRRRAS